MSLQFIGYEDIVMYFVVIRLNIIEKHFTEDSEAWKWKKIHVHVLIFETKNEDVEYKWIAADRAWTASFTPA